MATNFENLQADLVSQPITGFLNSTGQRIHLPLISHIEDNLYVGGFSDRADLGDFFGFIFSMYIWEGHYKAEEGTQITEVTMYDSSSVDAEAVERYSDEVVEALKTGQNVLVHCQAGINRSNLVAGRALMKMGRTAEEAIALLRARRGDVVLANTEFTRYLLASGDE